MMSQDKHSKMHKKNFVFSGSKNYDLMPFFKCHFKDCWTTKLL